MPDKHTPDAPPYVTRTARQDPAQNRKATKPVLRIDTRDLVRPSNIRDFIDGNFETEGEHGSHVFAALRAEREKEVSHAIALLKKHGYDPEHTLEETLAILHETVKKHEILAAEPTIRQAKRSEVRAYIATHGELPPPDSALWKGEVNHWKWLDHGDAVIAPTTEQIDEYGPDRRKARRPASSGKRDDRVFTLEDGSELIPEDKISAGFLQFAKNARADEISHDYISFDATMDAFNHLSDERRSIALEHLDDMVEYAHDFASWASVDRPEAGAQAKGYLDQFLLSTVLLKRSLDAQPRHKQTDKNGEEVDTYANDRKFVQSCMRDIMAHAIRDASDYFQTTHAALAYFEKARTMFEARFEEPSKTR